MEFNFKMRLIGYYNKPNQNMREEQEQVEDALLLAKLLERSFSFLQEDVQDQPLFLSILKGNTVFILKGEDGKLYAYYPYKKIARITKVKYVKADVTPMPFEYKAWFVPGQEISVHKKSEASPRNYAKTLQGARNDSVGRNTKILIADRVAHIVRASDISIELSGLLFWKGWHLKSKGDVYDLVSDSFIKFDYPISFRDKNQKETILKLYELKELPSIALQLHSGKREYTIL